MNHSFHPDAERELVEAAEYYETCKDGLGLEFVLDIDAAMERILAYPKAWPLLESGARRAQLTRFPYGLFYREVADHLYIVAVAHLHREPDFWRSRLT